MELTQRSYLDNQKKKKTHRIKLLKTLSLTLKTSTTLPVSKTITTIIIKITVIKMKAMLLEGLVKNKTQES